MSGGRPTGTAGRVLDALAAYDLREEGPGQWRANSPLRPGSNSHGFTLRITGDEYGTYYDHVSGDSGSLYELAEALQLETPRREVENSKRAYRDMADYATAHGLTSEVLEAAGWSQETFEGRPALAFKTATGIRHRFLDGEKPAYKSPRGYEACWYGLQRAVKLAGTGGALVLCNGEISTLAAQSAGIPACCVTGGEKRLPVAALEELRNTWRGHVWLAMDCDATGRRAAADIRGQLGGYHVTVVDLGLTQGGDLADFCRLYGEAAREELAKRAVATPGNTTVQLGVDTDGLANALRALQQAVRADDRARRDADLELLLAQAQAEIDRLRLMHAGPQVQSFAEVADMNLARLEEALKHPDPVRGLRSRINRLDRAVGGFTPEVYVIYGATSMGKSTLAVSLCREFLQQGAGLVVSTESPTYRWQTKLVASLCKLSSDRIESGQLSDEEVDRVRSHYAMLSELNCHFLNAGSPTPAQVRAAVLRGVREHNYRWVIIDSASKMAAPGQMSIYDTTRAVSDGIQTLMQETNLPIVVTSQVGRDVSERGKGQKLPLLQDAYGGGPIEHNAGVVLGIYNHQYYVEMGTEEPDDRFPPGTALVRVLKNRWGGEARNASIPLRFVGGSGFYELDTTHREGVS